ncbi:MAG: tRNA (N6-threonylcarbamoyladenosine(37)-N6)-methyltransferase TrmO [Candidatus Bathyarchaeia archaeon]|nr:tRNA (N6-threonylcarbamoyladenosine(37)-N6)-methyltransferase TrmO [Candidatus Bathyarchaeota archaeon]
MGEEFKVVPIGVVEVVDDAKGLSWVRILPEFCDGLFRLDEFSHVIVFYWFHLRDDVKERRVLRVVPKRHGAKSEVGVFASRSPSRPNPIGFCVVELVRVDGCVLVVRGLDAFVGSPVIDVKPYLPRGDFVSSARAPAWVNQGPST